MARTYSVGEEPVPGSGYRLTEFLGRGGFGEVWKAVGPGGTEVAIKMIPLGGMEGRKEFRALQLVKRIRHPNLVPTIAFWVRDASGTTLDDAVVSQLDLRAPTVDENGFRATMAVPPASRCASGRADHRHGTRRHQPVRPAPTMPRGRREGHPRRGTVALHGRGGCGD